MKIRVPLARKVLAPQSEKQNLPEFKIAVTLAESVDCYNAWAEANGKRYRLRECGGPRPLEWIDTQTGETERF